MTPDDLWIEMAQFDAAHADRLWNGTAPTEDAPAWYGRVATLIRASAAPVTEDELAGESEIVARMQAAILEPGPEDELVGESDIVARMQATIFESGPEIYGDDDRPRHLRASARWPAGARRRQGAHVVRRIFAVKAAAVTTVVAIGVTAAAATTGIVATVVMPALSSHDANPSEEPKNPRTPDSDSSKDGSGGADRAVTDDTGDDDPGVIMDLEEPFVCMIDLDCLLQEVEEVAAAPARATVGGVGLTMDLKQPFFCMINLDCLLHAVEQAAASPPPTEAPASPTTTEPPASPTTTEPPASPTTTEAPPSPTTTEAPPPTTEPPTTTTTEPPTTTTTQPPSDPQAEVAGPPAIEPLSAGPGDTGRAAGAPDGTATTGGVTAAGGTGSEPPPAG